MEDIRAILSDQVTNDKHYQVLEYILLNPIQKTPLLKKRRVLYVIV